ncbi:hypothetical protein NPIL_32231 [Nephila pilipes]|uniref:Uncharacterized protein n=1 Tax=Nephila pilipes TaxID=299642 RepID=A0A8X6U7K2_NEPPI|nr:hypothetical protein NPIL_32231 [Nephila pilipes]
MSACFSARCRLKTRLAAGARRCPSEVERKVLCVDTFDVFQTPAPSSMCLPSLSRLRVVDHFVVFKLPVSQQKIWIAQMDGLQTTWVKRKSSSPSSKVFQAKFLQTIHRVIRSSQNQRKLNDSTASKYIKKVKINDR